MVYDNSDEIIEELFDLLLSRYQIGLEAQMRGNDFIFGCINLFYYKCHKMNFKYGGSTINPKNDDDRCFQYAATIALSFDETKIDPQRVLNIKAFINNYNWKEIYYPSKIEDWKRFKKQWLLMFCILKKKKYVQLIFQKLI